MFRFSENPDKLQGEWCLSSVLLRRFYRRAHASAFSAPTLLLIASPLHAAETTFDLAQLPGSTMVMASGAAPIRTAEGLIGTAGATRFRGEALARDPGLSPHVAMADVTSAPPQDSRAEIGSQDTPLRKRWADVRGLEFTFQALNLLDAVETVGCLEAGKCAERNPVYGSDPHRSKIVAAKVATGAIHYLVTRYMLKHYNEWTDEWLIGTIVLQGGVVMWNARFCF